MKELDVTLMPWKWNGVVCVGGTCENFKDYVKYLLKADIEVGEYSAGHVYVEYGKPWMLWVLTLTNVPTLVHEAFHVTSGVLEGRGLKHTPESEEAYTYTLEDIVRQTLNGKRWRTVKIPAKKKGTT